MLEEIKKWVGPFRANTKLKDALTTYLKPPQAYERLTDLSSHVSKPVNNANLDKGVVHVSD